MDDRYPSFGAVATIEQLGRLPGGKPAAVLRAEARARIGYRRDRTRRRAAGGGQVVEPPTATERAVELAAEYKALVVATLQRRNAWQIIDTVESITDPSTLVDTAGWAAYLPWLRSASCSRRPTSRSGSRRRSPGRVTTSPRSRWPTRSETTLRDGMEKNQREFLLRQQLAAIRKELGEDEPDGAQDYRSRVEAASLPDNVREAALREVGRLERASDQSPESGWIRTWLDTVLELPWNERTQDSADVRAARGVLDADHHGLQDVKDRIVEYLAVRARRTQRGLEVVGGRGSGAVLVLVGPPGVGKTSLGESVARALGASHCRVSLRRRRDEAESGDTVGRMSARCRDGSCGQSARLAR